MNILLIEDNQDLAANIQEYLSGRGHAVHVAPDGLSGLAAAHSEPCDVIILDILLPGLDGLSVCRRLRGEVGRSIPVLMLTARDTLADKLQGFEAGADDYLVKPFSLAELEARLRALARRAQPHPGEQLEVADLTLDQGTFEVRRAGRLLSLTPTGVKMLALFMRESPRLVTRAQIEQVLWGDDPPDSDALRAHIYALRNVIDKPFDVKLLQTVHGTGYRLVRPNAAL